MARRLRTVFLLQLAPALFLLMHGLVSSCEGSPGMMRAPRARSVAPVPAERAANSSVTPVLLSAITFFQKNLSPLDGQRCIFQPTCSHYARLAVGKYGVLEGLALSGDRLIRCNPSRRADRSYHLLPNGSIYDPLVGNAFDEK